MNVALSAPTIIARQTATVTVTMREASGATLPNALSEVTVTSSNTDVATVSILGSGTAATIQVLGVAPGSTTISVTALGQTGTSNLTVLPAVDVVRGVPDSLAIDKDSTRTLTALTLRSNGDSLTDRQVTFTSLNPAVATVTTTGLRTARVVGVAAGTASIVATVLDRADTIPVDVLVDRELRIVGTRNGGSGTIVSSPAGIDCTITAGVASNTCTATFKSNVNVRLTAVPASGSAVHSWQDLLTSAPLGAAGDSGTAVSPVEIAGCESTDWVTAPSACSVRMAQARTVGVGFYAAPVTTLNDAFNDTYASGPSWTTRFGPGGRSFFALSTVASATGVYIARDAGTASPGDALLSLATNIPVAANTRFNFDVYALNATLTGGLNHPTRTVLVVRNSDSSLTRIHYQLGPTAGTTPVETATDKYTFAQRTLQTWSSNTFRIRDKAPNAVRLIRVHLGGYGTLFGGYYDNVRLYEPTATIRFVRDTGTVAVNGILQLPVVMLTAAGDTVTDRTPLYTSLNTSVVTIGAYPNVNGQAAGTAQVVATSDGVADTATVTVVPPVQLNVRGVGFGGSGVVTSVPSGINCTIASGQVSGGTCTGLYPSGASVRLTVTPSTGHVPHSWQAMGTLSASTGYFGASVGAPAQLEGCEQNANGDAAASCTVAMTGTRNVGVGLYAPADTTFSEFFSDQNVSASPAWTPLWPDTAFGNISTQGVATASISQNSSVTGIQKTTRISVATNVRVLPSTQFRAQLRLDGTLTQNTSYPARIVLVTANAAGDSSRIHYLFGPSASTIPASTATDRYVFTALPFNTTTDVALRLHDVDTSAVRVLRVHLGSTGQSFYASYDNLQLVSGVARVVVTPAEPAIQPGDSVQLAAVLLGVGGDTLTGRTISWSSANTSVATVNASGWVRAVAGGLVTVTATADGVSGTASVNVVTNRTLTIRSFEGGGTGTVVSSPTGINCSLSDGTASGTCSATFASNVDVTLTASGASGAPVHAWQNVSNFTALSGGVNIGAEGMLGAPTGCAQRADGTAAATCVLRALTNRTVGVTWYSAAATTLNDAFTRSTFAGGAGWVPQVTDSGTVVYRSFGNEVLIQRSTASGSIGAAALSARTDVPIRGSSEFRMRVALLDAPISSGVLQPARAILDLMKSDSAIVRLHLLFGTTQGTLPANTATDIYRFTSQSPSSTSANFVLHAVRLREIVPSAVSLRRVVLGGAGSGFSNYYDDVAVTAAVDTVRLDRDTLSLSPGNTYQTTVAVRSSDGVVITDRTPTWTSSNPGVASVSTAGLVTAATNGSAQIIATVDGKADTLTVTVVTGVNLTIAGAFSGGQGRITSSPGGIDCTVFSNLQTSGTCTRAFPTNSSVTLTAETSGGQALAGWSNAPSFSVFTSGTFTGTAASPQTPPGCAADANRIVPATCSVTLSGARTIGVAFYPAATTSLSEDFEQFFLGAGTQYWSSTLPDSGSTTVSRVGDNSSIALEVSRSGAGTATRDVRVGRQLAVPITAATELRLDAKVVSSTLASGGATGLEYGARAIVTVRNADSSRTRLHYFFSPSGGTPPANTATDRYVVTDSTVNTWRSYRFRLRDGATNAVRVERIDLGGSGWDFSGRYDNVAFREAVQTLRLTPDTLRVRTGQTASLTATLIGASNDTLTGRSIAWTSLDTLIARVGSTGLVTATATPGTTRVIATSEGKADTAVIVTLPTRTLTVTGLGSGGSGVITSAPAGITCSFASGVASGTCSTTFAEGDTVRLTATPSSGHAIQAWQGGTVSSTVTGGLAGRNAVADPIESACRFQDSLTAPSSCLITMSRARTVGVSWYAPAVTTISESFADGNFTAGPAWAPVYADSGTTTYSVASGELTIARSASNGFQSPTYLATATNIPVTALTRVRLDVRVNSLVGAATSTNYPARVILTVVKSDSSVRRIHVFYGPSGGTPPTDTGTDTYLFRAATIGALISADSINIRAIEPQAVSLRRIHLGGAGSDFSASFDNISVVELTALMGLQPAGAPPADVATARHVADGTVAFAWSASRSDSAGPFADLRLRVPR